MSHGGILQHGELVRDKAKTFDFTIPDEKLQGLWQSVGVAVLGYGDPRSNQQLCILSVSSQLCRQAGLSAASIVGDTAKHIYTHTDVNEQQKLETAWRCGKVFSGLLAFGPDSSSVDVHICSCPLPPCPIRPPDDKDPGPAPLAASTVVLHTTSTLDSGEDSPQRPSSILEPWARTSCVVTADDSLTLQRLSEGFCAGLGYSPDELLGKSLFSLRGPGTHLGTLRSLARSIQACCSAAAEGMSHEPECSWRLLLYRSSGEPFQAGVLAMPVPDCRSGCSSCWLCVCDITATGCPRVGEITLGRVLGAGAFGTVHIGQLAGTPGTVAVKVVDAARFRNIRDVDQMRNELAVMQALRHSHIIDLLDVVFHANRFYIVLECATGGDLKDHIRAQAEGHLSEAEAQRIFRQCVSALIFCQRRHVCHRDLKPENILLDGARNCKIADFGLASVVAPGTQLLEYCGTPAFSAPELFSGAAGHGYDGGPADVWSMAVVLYECLVGRLPFSSSGGIEALKQNIRSGKYPPLPERLSPALRDLLGRMLVVDVERRILLEEIVSHEWYLISVDGNHSDRSFRVRMRPTLEEADRASEDASASRPAAAAGAAAAGLPRQAPQRQLSLHSSVQVRLDLDAEDLEDMFASASLRQASARGAEEPPAAATKEGGSRLPATDAPRVPRARFGGTADAGGPSPRDTEESRLPVLKKRAASFSGAKAASCPGGGARDMARVKSAAGTNRRRSSTLGSAFPAIGAQR